MSLYIYIIIICFIMRVSTSAFLNDTESSNLADRVCDFQQNQCRPGSDQLFIIKIDCEDDKHVVLAPIHKSFEVIVSVEDIVLRFYIPYRTLMRIIYLLLPFMLLSTLWDEFKKLIKPFKSTIFNLYLPVNEGIRNIESVGSYNAESLDSVRFTKVWTLNKPNDLEAGNTRSSIVDIYWIEYGTQQSSTLRSSRRDRFIVSAAEDNRVQEINSTTLSIEPPNSLPKITIRSNKQLSSQHDSTDESRSNTMWVSALVENNDSLVENVNRRRTHLMKSVRSERNLSRSVFQKSFQSNYSFSTDSYSSVKFPKKRFRTSVSNCSLFSGASSSHALSPNLPLRENEMLPFYHQLTQVPRGHHDSRGSLIESTIIRSRRFGVSEIDGEQLGVFDNTCLNQLNEPFDSGRKSVPVDQKTESLSTASHEDIYPSPPLSVVFARMDGALRNIGRVRPIRNDEEQNSERSISMQSDYSFSTASLRSNDSSLFGSSVNSSRSSLSIDSGITNFSSDVENVLNE